MEAEIKGAGRLALWLYLTKILSFRRRALYKDTGK